MKFKHGEYTIEVQDCDNVSKKEIQQKVIKVLKTIKDEKFKAFEVLWYEGEDEVSAMQGDYYTEEFTTRKEALDFYNKHKSDADKFGWWVTERDKDWNIVEDIII